jgi:hypothetical protein
MVDVPERRVGRVITAVTLSGSDVDVWWEQFREAGPQLDGDGGLSGFRSVLASAAADRGLRTAAEDFERYLDQESGVDESVLKQVLSHGADLPDIYRELAPFGWVSDESWDQLDDLWPRAWPSILEGQLDWRWGDSWRSEPDAYKTAWLDGLMPEFVLGGEAALQEPDPAPAVTAPEEPAPDPGAVAAQAMDLARQAVAAYRTRNPGAPVPPDDLVIRLLSERMKNRI